MIPRKNEVAVVVEILSSDEFDSPEDMAKAIIKGLSAELGLRQSYVVVHDSTRVWGPFYVKRDAEKFGGLMAAAGGSWAMAPMLGTSLPQQGVVDSSNPLCSCGHVRLVHGSWTKGSLIPGPGRCNWKGCDCTALDVNRAS